MSEIKHINSSYKNRFGTLRSKLSHNGSMRRSIANFIRKKPDRIIAHYMNGDNTLELKYVDNKLILEIKTKKSNVRAWIWNIELEIFIEYLKLIYIFCNDQKSTKKRNNDKIELNFKYKFENDPDNIEMMITPRLHRRKYSYCIKLYNQLSLKSKIKIYESQLLVFINSCLILDKETY